MEFEEVGEVFFGVLGEVEALDAVGGVFLDSLFGELEAEAGFIDGGAGEVWEGEELFEDGGLGIEGGVF